MSRLTRCSSIALSFALSAVNVSLTLSLVSITVDIANQTYYDGLNTALNTLQGNDNYLKGLLTWESL